MSVEGYNHYHSAFHLSMRNKAPKFCFNGKMNIFVQLLHTKIPKMQKDIDNLTESLHFWDLLV